MGVEACEQVEPRKRGVRPFVFVFVHACVCMCAPARLCVDVTDAPGRGYHHGNWIEAVSAPERLLLLLFFFFFLFHARTGAHLDTRS